MHGPPLVCWLLVALAGTTGLYGLLRMRGAGARDRRTTGGEALTGLGMAAMAVPASALDARPFGPVLLAALFTAAGVRSMLLTRSPGRRAHHAHDTVGAAAMVYMALAMSGAGGGGHPAHGPAGVPALTGALLVYFAASALYAAPRLLPAEPAPTGDAGDTYGSGHGPARAPGLAAACRVSMGIGMFAMLLTM